MSDADTERRTHTSNQGAAADPAASAWVGANAGSGKTSVLVDRVTRLLLAGTRPGAILCLTFTKAAAAEMQLRLTRRLGAWTTLDDTALGTELLRLLGRPVTDADRQQARRLFAATLEVPGGLRLQTVHAFCEALLKRFPLEAGVAPGFAVADDARAAELLQAARLQVLGAGGPVIRYFAERFDDGGFADLLQALLGRRRDLALLLETRGGAAGAIGEVYAALQLAPDADAAALVAAHIAALPLADLRRAVAALCGGGSNDRKLGEPLAAWLADGCPAERFKADWLARFFTSEGDPRKKLATAAALKLCPDCGDILGAEQQRLIALRGQLDAVATAEATAKLLQLAELLLDAYAAQKQARSLLDYDDLILRSRGLLVEPGRVDWVMYKLDQGIDHVLVDEAQDTSPDQWDVVAALTDDFFSGTGARADVRRTVFAVGDVKQSIYSFQGARPQAFLDMQAAFAHRAAAAGQQLRRVPLEMSFRSAPALLQLVDAVFAPEAARPGVVEPGAVMRHKASRATAAGRIELWPPVAPDLRATSEPWEAPLDYVGALDPRRVLATRIAARIAAWIDAEDLPGCGRPLRPGDVMILVRRRNSFFEAIVQALKAAGVPVAGADRMVLAEQMAVLDLLALAGVCLLPEDDLGLATVLKGPLFNFSEDDLFDLCHDRREQRVWHELQRRAAERPHWQAACTELRALLARADLVPPFAFLAELLGAGGGRARLVARLGPQANEPIDELLAAALTFEREMPPSLQGFLDWFPRHAGEVKRDLDQGRDEVRVLTVHGAKGLEAPVVILPDTCDLPNQQDKAGLLWGEAPVPPRGPLEATLPPASRAVPQLFWPRRKSADVPLTAALRARREQEQQAEYRRLLYVALTRARDRLYICGYLNSKTAAKGPPPGSWYDLVATGFATLAPQTAIALPWGEAALRFESHATGREESRDAAAPHAAAPAPDWLQRPPPPEPLPPRPLAPSRPSRNDPPPLSPGAPERLAGLARGRLIHRLLQTLPELPEPGRATAAARFLADAGHGLDAAQQAEIAAETLAVLQDAAFAAVFGPAARAEAPLVGRIGAHVVTGQVDRLVVGAEEILVVDYKTNRPPPARAEDVDPAYLDQMALYRGLLQAVFPGRPVRAALLWTYAPRLMALPETVLDARFAAFTAT